MTLPAPVLAAATADPTAAASLLGAPHVTPGGGAVTLGGDVFSVELDGGFLVNGTRVADGARSTTTTTNTGIGNGVNNSGGVRHDPDGWWWCGQ